MMKHGDEVREDRRHRHLGALGRDVLRPEPALDDGRLEIELHERRDRRPDGRDEEDDVRAVQVDLRLDDRAADRAPVRVREDRRDRIREERDRHRDEDPLRELVRAAHDEEPDHDRGDRHRDLRRHVRRARAPRRSRRTPRCRCRGSRTAPRTVEKSDQRGPYCSRISSASPLPVTAPIRAAISCTTMRLIVISTIIQRRS